MIKGKIKSEAKEIMNSFMDALGDIELEENFELIREECFREDGEGAEVNEDFRLRFFANAPRVKGDSIVTEKGTWI